MNIHKIPAPTVESAQPYRVRYRTGATAAWRTYKYVATPKAARSEKRQLAEVGDGDWGKDANAEAFSRSCANIVAAWQRHGRQHNAL